MTITYNVGYTKEGNSMEPVGTGCKQSITYVLLPPAPTHSFIGFLALSFSSGFLERGSGFTPIPHAC